MKQYISYNKEGRVKVHRFLIFAIIRAKYYKTSVDSEEIIDRGNTMVESRIIENFKSYREE